MSTEPLAAAACARAVEMLVREVGLDLLRRKVELQGALSDAGRDIKVAADLAAERAFVTGLDAIAPIPILSEEAGWIDGRSPATRDDFYWVVDPLDGSYNYHRGLPGCCISIALCCGMSAALGVIYDFQNDEMFVALEGGGASLNSKPIRVSDAAGEVGQAVLMTGFPLRAELTDARLEALGGDLARWKKVRMIGSAATSLAYVACGRADAYGESGISWWDVAAGMLLVREAGGQVSLTGDDPRSPVRARASAKGLPIDAVSV